MVMHLIWAAIAGAVSAMITARVMFEMLINDLEEIEINHRKQLLYIAEKAIDEHILKSKQ